MNKPLSREFAADVTRHLFSSAIYLYEPSDGGLDRVAISLANHLHRTGHPVELWMARAEGPLASLIDPGVPIRLVPAPRWTRGLSMLAQWLPLRRMVRRTRPDILYSAGNQSNLLVAAAALGTGTRAIGRISNPIVRPGSKGIGRWLRRARFRLTQRASAMTIVMGKPDRDILAGGAGDPGRIALLPRPTITPAMTQAARNRSPRRADAPLEFLAVGRLMPQKDHATMLRALALLDRTDWRLRIAGQGPLQAELEQQCNALGIADRVEFLGFVDDPTRLAALYGEADMLLHSARWEGFCGTVIEALGSGCQVVATQCTANLDGLMRRAGQQPLVPVGDAAAFARAIERTIDAPAAPSLLAGATAPFAIGAAMEKLVDALRSMVMTGEPPAALKPNEQWVQARAA